MVYIKFEFRNPAPDGVHPVSLEAPCPDTGDKPTDLGAHIKEQAA